MASIKLRLPYQKLRKQPPELDDGHGEEGPAEGELYRRARAVSGGWLRLGRARRRRWGPRVRILALRRLLGRRGRRVTATLGRVVRRLREGRNQLGDLFAGNYLFVQVSPAPVGSCLEKPCPAIHGRVPAALPPPASWYCLPGVA